MRMGDEIKKVRRLIYILDCLEKNEFCCKDLENCSYKEVYREIFKTGAKKFLISKPGRKVKKVIGAFKTLNNGFNDFRGDVVTPHIFKEVSKFMREYFPEDEFFSMSFLELRGPYSEN